jgi:hypothetical protein
VAVWKHGAADRTIAGLQDKPPVVYWHWPRGQKEIVVEEVVVESGFQEVVV